MTIAVLTNPNTWPWVTDNMNFVNPVGLGFTILMAVLFVALPRKWSFMPILALTCFMTMGQRVMIVGLNFTMIRILILMGWVRLFVRHEIRPIKFHTLDKVILIWSGVGILCHTLLYMNSEALVYRTGQAYNAVGTYFLFRYLIRDWNDITRILRILATFAVPLAALMVLEKFTGRNAFVYFGGVPEMSEIRRGVVRCQGPFAHSILAGTFGAALLPMFLAATRVWRDKALAYIALASAGIIAVSAGSSGPIMAGAFGMMGFFMWPFRSYMRQFRWAIVIGLATIQLFMKAPIWFLIARVTVFDGNTGYHRSWLIHQTIMNFSEWFLFGTKSTAHWGYEMIDITNQYIRQGIEGGVWTMVLFICVLVYAFKRVGIGLRKQTNPVLRREIWAFGSTLIVHMFSFISVSYFDQNFVSWYMLLAIIASVHYLPKTAAVPQAKLEPASQPQIVAPTPMWVQ